MVAWKMILVLLAGAFACSRAQPGGAGGAGGVGGATVAVKSIEEVLAAHTDSLMKLPGVVGTALGLCEGERCIQVLLADSSAGARSRIPSRLEGYRVVTLVTGPIKPR
jgi:hypothetical protein